MSFTYPFSIPSGTNIIPIVSGNNSIGSIASPINNLQTTAIGMGVSGLFLQGVSSVASAPTGLQVGTILSQEGYLNIFGTQGTTALTSDANIDLENRGTGTFNYSELSLARSRGAFPSVTGILSGDDIGHLGWWGSADISGNYVNGASIRGLATENFTTGTGGTKLQISTVEPTTSTLITKIEIGQSGTGYVGTTAAPIGMANILNITGTNLIENTIIAKTLISGQSTVSAVGGNIVMNTWKGGASYNSIYLNGDSGTSTNYNFISSSTNQSSDQALYINRPTSSPIIFLENNSVQMTIYSGGHVGIGTASVPSVLLEVNGTARANTSFTSPLITGNAAVFTNVTGTLISGTIINAQTINTVNLTGTTISSTQYKTTIVTITQPGTGLTINWNSGCSQIIDFKANTTGNCYITHANGNPGTTYTLICTNNTTGNSQTFWTGNSLKWANGNPGGLTQASGAIDIFNFFVTGTSSYFGVAASNFL